MTLSEARLRLYDLSLRSYEKVPCHKKFLEIDFRGSLFYEKLANLFDGLSWRSYEKVAYHKKFLYWKVVVAQLVERSLSIPEVRGSTPVIGKILLNICYYKLYWKDENK